ncbi:MAG: restriction endonuclease subunit S [Planctomycetes bacterium]|nr:restriction endonuclease subunit S [Planctomycetota bacterium]
MNVLAFGDLFQFIRNGMSVKQDKSGAGLPISRIETIADGSVNPNRVGFAGLSAAAAEGWLLETGDILFSHINSVEHVGKCAVYRGVPEVLVHGMNLLNLRCDQGKIVPEFAKYLIRSPGFRGCLASFINKAVNQASVSIGNLRTIPVIVPPLSEQRSIAAILDQADALRSKRREALAQLDSIKQAIFIDMFGDPRQLPRAWPSAPLSALGRVTTGRTPPTSKEGMFGGAVPFITPGDLESEHPAKRTLTAEGVAEINPVRAGATLVCCIGTVGKMGMAKVRSGFNQQINAVDWNSTVDDTYGLAALFFRKGELAAQAASTTVPILNKSTFEKFEIQVPPLDLQRIFAARIQAVEGLKITHRAALAESDALFASLQHRAFAVQVA